jgi:hypothetical protein
MALEAGEAVTLIRVADGRPVHGEEMLEREKGVSRASTTTNAVDFRYRLSVRIGEGGYPNDP